MHVEELPSLKEVASTLGDVRQRVSDSDLGDASRSALTSAREAVADGWPRRRRPSRWPWVAGVIVGMTVLGLMLMTPTFRRWSGWRRDPDGPADVMGDAMPAPAAAPADETGDAFHPAEPHAVDTTPQVHAATE